MENLPPILQDANGILMAVILGAVALVVICLILQAASGVVKALLSLLMGIGVVALVVIVLQKYSPDAIPSPASLWESVKGFLTGLFPQFPEIIGIVQEWIAG